MNIHMNDDLEKWTGKNRYLDLIDDPWFSALTHLQHELTIATMLHWDSLGFKNLHLPITTNSISSPMGLGSDSLPVEIDLFGKRTFLADSMQFLLEYGCRLHADGCFYLMPSFRGESSDETHLNQFFHSEIELCGGLDDAIGAAEGYLRALSRRISERCESSFSRAEIDPILHVNDVANGSGFARLTFDEANSILKDVDGAIIHKESWRNLTRKGELELLKHCGGPVWITHWDHLAVPFYQAFHPSDERVACNADLVMGVGEVIGLGERHKTDDEVRRALSLHKVGEEPYEWYLNMKREYPLRTSGFGMGVERFILWVLSHSDIRDTQILPRFNGIDVIP